MKNKRQSTPDPQVARALVIGVPPQPTSLELLLFEARQAFETAFAAGQENFTTTEDFVAEYGVKRDQARAKALTLARYCRDQHEADADRLLTELAGHICPSTAAEQCLAGGVESACPAGCAESACAESACAANPSLDRLNRFFIETGATPQILFSSIARGIDLKLLTQAIGAGISGSKFGAVMARIQDFRYLNDALDMALNNPARIDAGLRRQITPLLGSFRLAPADGD